MKWIVALALVFLWSLVVPTLLRAEKANGGSVKNTDESKATKGGKERRNATEASNEVRRTMTDSDEESKRDDSDVSDEELERSMMNDHSRTFSQLFGPSLRAGPKDAVADMRPGAFLGLKQFIHLAYSLLQSLSEQPAAFASPARR